MFYEWRGQSLLLKLHVQPNAKLNTVIGIHNDALKLKIISPPVDGKANKTIIRFLADQFNVPKSAIEIVSGEMNREKRVAIKGAEVLPAWFEELADDSWQ